MRNGFTSAFTVDVEDGVSIAMRDAFNKTIQQTNRVLGNTQKVLELLGENHVKGTFFILGQVAEVFPKLVKEIADKGHEVGVHGYDHWQFFKMDYEYALKEISNAKKLIEDTTGKAVYGHRAPAFSINPQTMWGLDVIARAGFIYDSSIMPCKTSRYGWRDFPKNIVNIQTVEGYSLIEVPLSTDRIIGKEIPICGGSYLRLFPKWLTERSFEKVAEKRPVNVYMHPYEMDTVPYPDYYFEELKKAGLIKRLKMRSMWINRSSIYPKLSYLLKKYEFDTMINIVRNNEKSLDTIKV